MSASIGPGFASSIASDRNLPVKPIECTAIASVPASAPGPNTATKNSAHTIACTERVATRMKRPMVLSTTERVMLRATSSATRLAIATARMRAERRGVQRLDQGRVHDLRVPGPVDRPHAREQVGGLLRRVVEEFRDDLDAAQRPHDRDQHDEIERRAHDALGEREALPCRRNAPAGPLVSGASVIGTASASSPRGSRRP